MTPADHGDVPHDLARLAAFHGVQTSYEDWRGREVHTSTSTLLAVLAALGVDLDNPEASGEALRRSRIERAEQRLPPVVARLGTSTVTVPLRLPRDQVVGTARCELTLESGERRQWDVRLDTSEPVAVRDIDGTAYAVTSLPVPAVPDGYHRLAVEHGGQRHRTQLIVAPERAYGPPTGPTEVGPRAEPPVTRSAGGPVRGPDRHWGVFLPLYALRTARDWGVGDLTDLRELAAWAGEFGADVIGTLPLLPTYLGAGRGVPFDPSPYSPVSRLFWNELYLDLGRAPELQRCRPARRLLDSDELAASITDLRHRGHVDYRRLAALKRRVLAALADDFFDAPGRRREDFESFVTGRPLVRDYARFRGAVAAWGADRADWPPDLADSGLNDPDVTGPDLTDPDRTPAGADIDQDETRLHLYAQFLAAEQVEELAGDLRGSGQHPYLDLPIGTRADGFDVWRFPELFATAAATGAPPDEMFTGGQNWAFPPLHPQELRRDGYGYVRDVLGHHLALADWLRLDHVMGLHRLYWIPDGFDSSDGAYVRYPADEWYAVLTLESHRYQSRLIGENLGTVPDEVEVACRARGITRMYVVQNEARLDREAGRASEQATPSRQRRGGVLPAVPEDTLGSVNTHDMPPFAGFWHGRDLVDGVDLGLLDADELDTALARRSRLLGDVADFLMTEGLLDPGREDDPSAVHTALLTWLGACPGPIVLANLEDLWLEQRPQNTPGTSDERPNWRRRAAYSLDEIRSRDDVTSALRRLDDARSGGSP